MATAELIAAVEAATREIEALVERLSSPYMAGQSNYGVEFEVLAGGYWFRFGDHDEAAEIEAVRLFDCDGNRGLPCRTVAEVRQEMDLWCLVAQ